MIRIRSSTLILASGLAACADVRLAPGVHDDDGAQAYYGDPYYGDPYYGDPVEPSDAGDPWADARFQRGDVNADGRIDLTDANVVLAWLYQGGAAPAVPDAADVDDDGEVGLTDAVALLGWLFQGGAPPAEPFVHAGLDPTRDDLGGPSAASDDRVDAVRGALSVAVEATVDEASLDENGEPVMDVVGPDGTVLRLTVGLDPATPLPAVLRLDLASVPWASRADDAGTPLELSADEAAARVAGSETTWCGTRVLFGSADVEVDGTLVTATVAIEGDTGILDILPGGKQCPLHLANCKQNECTFDWLGFEWAGKCYVRDLFFVWFLPDVCSCYLD